MRRVINKQLEASTTGALGRGCCSIVVVAAAGRRPTTVGGPPHNR